MYYCKRTKYWKICQDGHPLRENGWNYSQIAEEDSDMPPLGLWTNEKKIQRETKREYADFRVEMVSFFIFCCCCCCCCCCCYSCFVVWDTWGECLFVVDFFEGFSHFFLF